MLSLILLMTTIQDPVGPLPSANQMAWHARQYYAFVHFGPNTFTGIEWGHGTEDPKVFDPTALDARQWCRTFKEAGMTGVIITAKHHDGFALWPSKQTNHSVAASKWRDGKGDVLKELSEACKEYGLWMGVYLSPWDRNHPTYGTPEYNDVFVAMLEEVLTKYGDMKEVWFDGANGEGPNGKRQVYDWPRFEATVRKFAPNAVIFGDGGDVRWVGNEQGFVGETNWNFLPSGHWPGDQAIYHLLNSGDPKGDKYSPGECDVSIRPGWFWRESENDKVKSLEQLQEIWYRSIGHGGNLLLNVPPDTRGLIHENDVKALMEFKRWRDATFGQDLFRGHVPPRSDEAKHLYDGMSDTFWSGRPSELSDGTVRYVFPLKYKTLVDHLVIRERLQGGQRIESYFVDKNPPGSGHVYIVADGTTVGNARIVKFEPTDSLLELVVSSRSGPPQIASIEAYLGPPSVEIVGSGAFIGTTIVEIKSDNPQAAIRYTLDGTDPTSRSTEYTGPVAIDRTCTLKATAIYDDKQSFKPAVAHFEKFDKLDLWPATIFIREPDPGLRYSYYDRRVQTLDQIKDLQASGTGVSTSGLDLMLRKQDENFALVFTGVVSVPQDGIYNFKLTSDDGSRLYIDEHLVVDNDGLHGMETKQGIAPLAAGYHRVRIEYFNATGGMGLKLDWQGPGVQTGPVPASAFRH
ncbi:MAG: alpha-L-fucosidase [Fimbriimonadaceae bacterium]